MSHHLLTYLALFCHHISSSYYVTVQGKGSITLFGLILGSLIGEEPHDAFYAIGVGIVPVLSEDVLVFSTVQLDEAGLYDATTGKYNVISDGIYIFYATLCVDKDKMIQVEFIAGQDRIGMLTTSTSVRSNCASSTAMAR